MTKQAIAGPAEGLSWRHERLTPALGAALVPEWADLAAGAAEQNIFSFPWFLLPSLPLLAPLDPHIITIRDGGRLIGLSVLRRDIGLARLPVPFVKTALHYGQYLGTPLVRAGEEARFVQGVTAWLDDAPAQVGFLKLKLLPEGGPVAAAILAHCRAERRLLLALNRFERAAIRLGSAAPPDPDAYLGSGRRKSLRRARAGLEAMGAVTVERLDDPAALPAWTESFLAIEHSGWKGEKGSSILSWDVEAGFYRDMIAGALRENCLNLMRLCVGGTPIAYTLDIDAAGHVFCLKTAYDPAYRRYSPGVLMEVDTLRHYAARGDIHLVDSCTAPDNQLLNELWPDRRAITDLVIARRGLLRRPLFRLMQRIKQREGGVALV